MASRSAFLRFDAFLGTLVATAAELVGADRVDLRAWDRLPESEGNVAGAARIGSGLMLVGHHVPGFIEGLLVERRRELSATEMARLRKMLGTLLHESIHLALPSHHRLPWRSWRASSSVVFLEEGVTEAATQALLPRLLARLEPAFPGVSRDLPDRSWHYANYVPATRELVSLVSKLPEMGERDPLLELARVGPERKFDLLVEQAMEGFGLTFNVPARDRRQARYRIRAALDTQVECNRPWMEPPDPREPAILNTNEPAALSTIMGKQVGMELLRQLSTEGERAAMDLPEGWRHTLAEREFKMAKKLVGSDGFTGPEARWAVRAWIQTPNSARGEPPPSVVRPGDRSRRPNLDAGRDPWTRYRHASRGMAR